MWSGFVRVGEGRSSGGGGRGSGFWWLVSESRHVPAVCRGCSTGMATWARGTFGRRPAGQDEMLLFRRCSGQVRSGQARTIPRGRAEHSAAQRYRDPTAECVMGVTRLGVRLRLRLRWPDTDTDTAGEADCQTLLQ